MKPVTARHLRAFWSVTFADNNKIDLSAYHKLSYGLFVVTAKDKDKDNGCISNTAIQVALGPDRMAVSLQNNSLTKEIIEKKVKYSNINIHVNYEVVHCIHKA